MKVLRCAGLTMAVLLLIWLVFPKRDIVSPDWDVLVTDMHDQPIAGVQVTDFSQQYTLESQDTEESAITGADGRVHFHLRTIRATGFRRVLGGLGQLQYGPHGSYGVRTYIHANKDGYGDPMKLEDFAQNERESTAGGAEHQSAHLRLLKCPDGYGGIGCTFPADPSKPILPFKP